MISRSQSMARSKEELKNQLLSGFRKKKQQKIVQSGKSQPILASTILRTPQNYYSCFNQQNRSILDQFSKCPVTEQEIQYYEQPFLNKFMFVKNRPTIPNSTCAKTSVEVQVQAQNLVTQTPKAKQNIRSENRQFKTPIVTKFDEKVQKSLIDVSGNLSSYKYLSTDQKNNQILTDSIIHDQNSGKSESHHTSTEQLLKQLQGDSKKQQNEDEIINALKDYSSQSVDIKQVKSEQQIPIQKQIQQKEVSKPIVKKIVLTRPSHQQNKSENLNSFEEDDRKIQKLLTKKNSIKDLIIQKSQQKSLPIINPQPVGRWSKTQRSASDKSIQINKKKSEEDSQIDMADLLPPYDSSSSDYLEAVIEQENQSEMEQSVKHKNKIHEDLNGISKWKDYQKIQINKVDNIDAQKKEQKAKIVQPQQKQQKNSLKSSSLSEISLEDLEDVSEIENVSETKNLKTLNKKSQTAKSDQLPDYQSDEESNNKNKSIEKAQLQKYIISDISNDLKSLKQKIISDSSLSQEHKPKDVFNLKIPSVKRISQKGSEGPDKQMKSMSDFFDEVNDKLDFKQISKDIIELRDRIHSDSFQQ